MSEYLSLYSKRKNSTFRCCACLNICISRCREISRLCVRLRSHMFWSMQVINIHMAMLSTFDIFQTLANSTPCYVGAMGTAGTMHLPMACVSLPMSGNIGNNFRGDEGWLGPTGNNWMKR